MIPAALAADVASAPLSSASSALNGMVRVYLSSLGSPSSLNVTVAGNYSINGSTSLSSGETVSIGFSSATGAITLSRGGVKTNMGSYFALRRHSASGSNGVKIAQARRPGNPYPGDLSFRAVPSGNGYKLYTVAHVYIEDYLYGVLPYEMGNGASVEALKAQAVAARTYTVRMMNSRSSGYYDVVDTTSDQVYNGTPSGYANCVSAVNATKGVVMMYGSSYTATYYSASNGGQTEDIANIWGSSGYPYLIVKDDPFDYDSPGATVKKATVSTDCASGSTSSALKSLLKSKAISALNSAGYAATSANTTLRTVVSVTPHTPKYSAPSRLYTKLDFALTASTANRSGATVTASVTVTCGIFTELESLLGMSIQSSQNELWTVRATGSSFVLEARRYGHGLGMSQRGAMYMGTLGYSYDQILGFYYPGCKRVAHSFTNTILNTGSSEPTTSIETPVEVLDPTGGCTGVALSALPVRSAKAESASLLCTVAANSPVRVLSSDGTWGFIQYGEIKGYALLSALSLTGDAPAATEGETPTVIAGFATVSANGSLNLRSSGSLEATIVGSASSGATLTVLERGAAWSRVQSGALAAYASNEFLSFTTAPAEPPTAPGEPTPAPSDPTMTMATAIVATESGSLNLRAESRAGSSILTTIPKGAQVTVTLRGDTWTAVSYNGYNGYVMTVFLAFSGASPTPAPLTGTTAIVTTASGSLNLRALGMAGSTILRTIPQYASVAVLQRGVEWSQVTYEGTTGYVMSAFLNFVEAEATPTPTPSVTPDPSASPSVDPSASPSDDPSASPSVDPSVSPEPSPTPSPTPAPTAETALVTTGGGSLNLRQEALPGSRILARIANGSTLVIEEKLAAWSRVSHGGFTGYVMNSYLTFTGETTTVTGATTATVLTASGSLNLRDAPNGSVLTRIPQLAVIEVRQRGATWCYVGYQGLYGYVMTAYLSFTEDTATPTPAPSVTPSAAPSDTPSAAPTETGVPAWVLTPSGSLNLREFTASDAQVLVEIPRLAEVTLLALGDTWSRVQYGAQIGFVMTQYLSMTRPDELGAQTPTPVPGPTPAPSTIGETPIAPPTPTPENEEIITIDPTLSELDTPIEASVSLPAGQSVTYLYMECDEQGALLTELADGETVAILEMGDKWCYVSYCGIEGYCLTDYLLGG